MTVFRLAKRIKRLFCSVQHGGDLDAPIQMRPVHSPCTNNLIGPKTGIQKHHVVVRADGPMMFSQLGGIGFTKREKVAGSEAAETQRVRAPFASFNGWVIVGLGCARRVQHNVEKRQACCVPNPCQSVAVGFAVGVDCRADFSLDVVMPFDHVRKTLFG